MTVRAAMSSRAGAHVAVPVAAEGVEEATATAKGMAAAIPEEVAVVEAVVAVTSVVAASVAVEHAVGTSKQIGKQRQQVEPHTSSRCRSKSAPGMRHQEGCVLALRQPPFPLALRQRPSVMYVRVRGFRRGPK